MSDDTRTTNTGLPEGLDEQSQNPVKAPAEWTTGDEPMTGPQASYLKTLMQQAGMAEDELDPALTKAAASRMIDDLRNQTGRGTGADRI